MQLSSRKYTDHPLNSRIYVWLVKIGCKGRFVAAALALCILVGTNIYIWSPSRASRSPSRTNVDSGEEVAIKLEHIDTYPFFPETEAEVYQSLSGGAGIPRVSLYMTECEYNAMVFDLLGPSLEDLFNYCSRKFFSKQS